MLRKTPLRLACCRPAIRENVNSRPKPSPVSALKQPERAEYSACARILHRDVKPSNLLIDDEGRCWVTDFGLASTGLEANITLSGDLLGTLRYMSPEQVAGTRNLDPRTDVYSLGATLYELLTGRPVLTGVNQAELVQQLIREAHRPGGSTRGHRVISRTSCSRQSPSLRQTVISRQGSLPTTWTDLSRVA